MRVRAAVDAAAPAAAKRRDRAAGGRRRRWAPAVTEVDYKLGDAQVVDRRARLRRQQQTRLRAGAPLPTCFVARRPSATCSCADRVTAEGGGERPVGDGVSSTSIAARAASSQKAAKAAVGRSATSEHGVEQLRRRRRGRR